MSWSSGGEEGGASCVDGATRSFVWKGRERVEVSEGHVGGIDRCIFKEGDSKPCVYLGAREPLRILEDADPDSVGWVRPSRPSNRLWGASCVAGPWTAR